MKRIILCGKAASGKDFARIGLTDNTDLIYQTSYTSRYMRDGEQEGVEYFYLTKEEFKKRIDENFWYEYVKFVDWYYGTSNDQFENGKLFIMTPSGIAKIKPEDRADSFVIYFDIDESIRKDRLIERNDTSDKAERRLKSDHDDFDTFNDFDLRIRDPKFEIDWLIGTLIAFNTNLIN